MEGLIWKIANVVVVIQPIVAALAAIINTNGGAMASTG